MSDLSIRRGKDSRFYVRIPGTKEDWEFANVAALREEIARHGGVERLKLLISLATWCEQNAGVKEMPDATRIPVAELSATEVRVR